MQISVLKPDDESIQKLQEVINYVYEVYKLENVEAYIVLDDGELGFVFYGENMNMYINNKKTGLEFSAFNLDENGELTYYGVDNYRIYFSDGGMDVLDKDNKQLSLYISRLSEGLEGAASFNGYFNFWQYDPKTDVSCSIQYAQNLREDIKKDISVSINDAENVFIDPRYSTKGGITKGFVGGGKKYFSRFTCETFDIGDFSVEESNKYLPIRYISSSNRYYTLGSFATKYDFSEIAKIIDSYGFLTEVPGKLIDIYKENDIGFRKLRWIINEVEKERNKEVNEKGMVFQIQLNEKDKN